MAKKYYLRTINAFQQFTAVPTNLVAAAESPTVILLAWNQVMGAGSYVVYRNGIGIASPSSPTYADSGLTPGTSYTYTVAALGTNGQSANSLAATATTPTEPIPAQITGLTATAQSTSSVLLTWTAQSSVTYNVYQNGTQLTGTLTSPTYTVNGLSAGTTYTFTVAAVNANGTGPVSANAPVITYPAQVTITNIQALTSTSTKITWSSVISATSYNVFRNGSLLNTTSSGVLIYTDSTVVSGTSYSYTVSATNASGTGTLSAPASLSVPAQVTWLALPLAPNSSSISMSWNAASGAIAYIINRNGGVIQTGYTSTTFTDTGLAANTNYTYSIAGTNSAGIGPYSVTETAATQPASSSGSAVTASGANSSLYGYLQSLVGTGKVLSGQHEEYDDNLNTMATIHAGTGQYPAICGTFAKLSGVTDDAGNATGTTAAVSNTWLAKGGIVLCTWVPPDPSYGAASTVYPNAGNPGNFPDVYANNGSAVSNAMNTMIDTLSEILGAINGTVILRPWAEMNGTWFWYAGGAANMIALWKYTFNRVVNVNGVKNALWLWNVNGGNGSAYYPGDAYVDLVSFEGYAIGSGTIGGSYDPLTTTSPSGTKPLMYGESGYNTADTSPAGYDIYSSLYKYTQTNMPKIIAIPVWGQALAIPNNENWQALFSDPTIIRLSDLPGNIQA